MIRNHLSIQHWPSSQNLTSDREKTFFSFLRYRVTFSFSFSWIPLFTGCVLVLLPSILINISYSLDHSVLLLCVIIWFFGRGNYSCTTAKKLLFSSSLLLYFCSFMRIQKACCCLLVIDEEFPRWINEKVFHKNEGLFCFLWRHETPILWYDLVSIHGFWKRRFLLAVKTEDF